MARSYLSQPTLDIDFIKPGKMKFAVPANATDGGRNLVGDSISMEATGGGKVTASYTNCYAQQPEEHEYLAWLAARLNGSFRFINVPLKTDWMGPFPIIERRPVPIITGIPHSDGSLFSDGSGYSQATVWAEVRENAALAAGQIKIRLYEATRPLRWSDWFSIYHADAKGWRAYRYWDVVSMSAEGSSVDDGGVRRSYRDYVLGIQPTLRAAVTAGTRIEFARPRFVAKLVAQTEIETWVESFWVTRADLQFEEAF